ncbi:cysteine sulfinic acid decarboxylase isoform X1 [Rhodnius prolixus]|uniref:cysteine sulfinic acid decarboxylase isoform X1 n=2 Tax=Rhodnius prolixus TaxID=13249 RepID=UPI003D18D581
MDSEKDVYNLLNKVLGILKEENALRPDDASPVILFKEPEKLKEILNVSLDEQCDQNELLQICKKMVIYSVKTGHKYFLNQLYGGMDMYGLAGAFITEALNTNQYTYEVAPVFTLCEMEVINRALSLIGFNQGDGIFCPGGSMSNMGAIVLARYHKMPEVKKTGLSGIPPFAIFTSQDAHYSIIKGAHWLGLGTDHVIAVKTDARGRMLPYQLEKAVMLARSKGFVPIFVNATAGTTVLGAFDPFEEISEVCKKYSLWLHIDGCWGGSVIFSKKHRQLLRGISRADSVSWNPHKLLGAPLQCSMLLVKKKGVLDACNRAGASYLFQTDKMYEIEYDTGDKSVQCGRKCDGFKFWMMWKMRGDDVFGLIVDKAMEAAGYFLSMIKTRPGFKLVLPEFQFTNICFWYIPVRLRNQEENEEWWEKVHTIAPKMKQRFVMDSVLMIGYQPMAHKNFKNFFRLVVTGHPMLTKLEVDRVVDLMEQFGADL